MGLLPVGGFDSHGATMKPRAFVVVLIIGFLIYCSLAMAVVFLFGKIAP